MAGRKQLLVSLVLTVALTACLAGAIASPAPATAPEAPGAPREAASGPPEAAGSAPAIPESVARMLTATDDEDRPLFDEAKVSAYLRGLPARVLDRMDARISEQWISGPRQLHTLLSPRLPAASLELALDDNCVLCHTDPDSQKKRTLFTATDEGRLDFRDLAADVHYGKGLLCSGCHGGDPTAPDHTDDMLDRMPGRAERKEDRAWIPEFCGGCHADAAFMRGFRPDLPTDQLAKYRESHHGKRLMQDGDSQAAQCVSCHGVHGIRTPDSPLSRVHPRRIADTCGECHASADIMGGRLNAHGKPISTDVVAQFRASVHGRALLEKGDLGAPTCNDCHGHHSALPPEAASVSQVCSQCHTSQGTLFDGSPHKEAFAARGWSECGQCHGNHDIQRPSDSWIGDTPGTLCHDCHSVEVPDQPECDRTAAHFRGELLRLVAGFGDLTRESHALREKGLDTEDISVAAADLEEAILQARTRIHAFDRPTFDQAVDAGDALLSAARERIDLAHAEYRFRIRGLTVSIAVLVLLAIAISLRLRHHEAAESAASGEVPRE